jgi:uncharacterized membrane protein
MKLDEIREALRALSPADLRAVLAEFAEAFSEEAQEDKAPETDKPATTPLEIATIVIADRQELLRRLAQR